MKSKSPSLSVLKQRFGWRMHLGVLLLAGVCIGGVAPAHASQDNDHGRARQAVEAGEALPWPVIMQRLQTTHPGQVLEVELERDHGRWIYEVKLLTPQGQLRKLEVDARDGTVLKDKRK